jgi:5-methylcytosine-specific restriction endonuclease McrA
MNSLILAVDSHGYPSRWLDWQDALSQQVLGKVAYGFGDHEFVFRGGLNRTTGDQSQISLRSILVLHGQCPEVHKRSTIPLSNYALFLRDRYICAYCGKLFRGGFGLTRDHIRPLSLGGKDTWLNTCACCTSCNARKGAQTLDQLKWELLYLPYAPNHQEGLILQNRRILGDQMDLLTNMVPRHSRVAQRSA